jgi:excisionase family DNA binding protein
LATKAAKKGGGGMSDLLSLTQAAERRGVSRAAIADLVNRKRLRSVNVGGKPHVYASDVDGFEKAKPGPKGKSRKR